MQYLVNMRQKAAEQAAASGKVVIIVVAVLVVAAVVVGALWYSGVFGKKGEDQQQQQLQIGQVMLVNFAPDTMEAPADYATELQAFKNDRPVPGVTRKHCGDSSCTYSASTGFGFSSTEGLRGWRYRHEGTSCTSLPFNRATLAHLKTGHEFKVDTPFGKGTYEITVGVGDCAFLADSMPRLVVRQGGESTELIGDADHAQVDGMVAVVTKQVRITEDTFAIVDPRTPNENEKKGTNEETVPLPYTIVYVHRKGNTSVYDIAKGEVPDVLTTIRSVYPTAQLAARDDIINLSAGNLSYCACGWVTKSRTDAALSTYYPSKAGTSEGCGAGATTAIHCGDDGPSWAEGKAGIYVKINPHPAAFDSIPAALDPKDLVAEVVGAAQPSAMQPTRLQFISFKRVA
jgi:hypothetical protein